jgi:hypothetical protein
MGRFRCRDQIPFEPPRISLTFQALTDISAWNRPDTRR